MKYEIMIAILFELLSKRCVSASYLAEKYEVSKRSIYRYINSLELAGVPLYTIRGNNGGIAIMDTYKISSTFMTVSEFDQVINALTAINDGVENQKLSAAILKLKAVKKNEYSGFDIKSGNLVIDGGPWGDTVGYKSKLKVLQKCADECLQLSIKYHDRNGSVTERVIDPYIIVFKQGLWYVYAFCHLRNEFRFFKTGRIESAKILSEFKRQDISEKNLPFDFWHNNVESVEVGFEVGKEVLSDVEEWLGIENVEEIGGKFKATAKLPNDDGLVSKIMSYGSGLKVLYPTELKNKIKKVANEILKSY
ncbi:MAG: YafY family transcriptional regulator [Clostridiales bacterium]|nr:YafY family transcriptional regulator [Clostridiales bacterium]